MFNSLGWIVNAKYIYIYIYIYIYCWFEEMGNPKSQRVVLVIPLGNSQWMLPKPISRKWRKRFKTKKRNMKSFLSSWMILRLKGTVIACMNFLSWINGTLHLKPNGLCHCLFLQNWYCWLHFQSEGIIWRAS